MRGTVIQTTGSWYRVRMEEGQIAECRIKGAFRLRGMKVTNPVAVGDHVEVEEESNAGPVISQLLPRKNYIIRSDPHKTEFRQVLAANIDQCIVMASLSHPRTSTGFIDRVLLTAFVYDIPARILFNKADLLRTQKSRDMMQKLLETYRGIGYTVFQTSALQNLHIEKTRALLKNNISLLIGHSGVGKSSLINKADPGLHLREGEISEYTGKGQHTTTFAQMIDLRFGGSVIDTPGIKEFGITDIAPQELSHYFPEMRSRIAQCRFNNCLHINESGCAVLDAVASGEISESRYFSYLSMYEELLGKKRW